MLGGHLFPMGTFFRAVVDAEAQRAIPVATLEVKKSEKVVLIVKHYSRTTLTVCQRIIIISFVAPS
jgi:ABC-type multidrug transport system ATPase subunit